MNIVNQNTFRADPLIDDVLEQARKLQPLIREHAAKGEDERRVVQPVIDAMTRAGLFKIATPRRYGGLESSMKSMLDLSAIVGEADGGTSWIVTLSNVCAWLTSLFPVSAQDEVFGKNPDAKVSGVLTPSATSRRVDGGFIVNGKWFYNSGSWHADWAVLGLPVVNEAGEAVDQGLALFSCKELKLEETWFVAGMSSSGSNCLIAENVFVPDHRIMSVPAAIQGDYPTERKEEEALYRSAFVPLLALVLVGPQLGMGRAALNFVLSKAPNKPVSYTFFNSQAQSTAFQLQVAEAALLIDTAHLHAYRAAADIDNAAIAGRYPDAMIRARVRADTGLVAEKITRAIDILLFAHGSGGFANTSPLQRIWRDSAVAARHAVALPQVGYEVYGKALLGVKEQITPLI
ncbi:acyl-CoA dehydrogenase family protein [Pseudorhodoplanes sinuspersici]|uniref:acyl-CoA dehydrogenase family protein n=1 Tax=Pseudorhodoplanes sinuspersici TaxID=1235591 RepID=UPI000FEE173C|nr:acyl-CoA dehydrogenase family protein [Pseudorhodoplanes sinuspersici]RKE68418.1 alkylation response protein AidB-like acyl-CoA dehydrogenase [Pseudorhodoplanes sinuspersici]